ncbi:MAG: oligosaccharide flippase family protein [Ferruginibacter sp.]
MKKKFLQDISLNTLQVIVVQSCGLVIFYLLSTRLNKSEFGEINWALAVLLTAFGILAFGIDQIAVRRIAAGYNPASLLSAYLTHVLTAGCIFYFILWGSSLVFPSFFSQHQVLLLLAAGKLMIFFSTPFKQLATGMEKFRSLLVMAVTSNIIRALALVVFDAFHRLDTQVIVFIFIVGDLTELLVSLFIMQRFLQIPLRLKWNKKEYLGLIKEAVPQFGVAIFTSALSRLDWIFLGLLASNIILANYSFAYKVFEVSTLPLLVIAPVLIPRFTKLFYNETDKIPETKRADLFVLLRLEIIVASFVALLLNVLWVPLIDLLTNNKYGSVNQATILILSATMPFLYFNNFLWTINFAKGRLKMIFYVFLISFLFNLAGDIVLIPVFKAEGAAVAYLIAIIVQSLVYLKKTDLAGLQKNSLQLLLCPLAAIVSGLLATKFISAWWVNLLLAPGFYLLLLYLTRQIKFTDWSSFKRASHF